MPDPISSRPAPAGPAPPAAVAAFILWFRPSPRAAWSVVAREPTERAAWAHVGTGGRKGGDYCCLPAGRVP